MGRQKCACCMFSLFRPLCSAVVVIEQGWTDTDRQPSSKGTNVRKQSCGEIELFKIGKATPADNFKWQTSGQSIAWSKKKPKTMKSALECNSNIVTSSFVIVSKNIGQCSPVFIEHKSISVCLWCDFLFHGGRFRDEKKNEKNQIRNVLLAIIIGPNARHA